MKKWTFLLVCLFAVNFTASAIDDKPIQVSEMPKAAQQFIRNYFPGHSVAVAKVEMEFMSKSYDVIFTNGNKVEFDKKGKWTQVDCEYTEVPQAILPVEIQKYVARHYPGKKVVKIEMTDRKGYEIELNDGLELEFDKRKKVIDIDR